MKKPQRCDEKSQHPGFPAIALITVSLVFMCQSCGAPQPSNAQDWLIDPSAFIARIEVCDEGRTLHLQNGLIRRTWRLSPNAATVDYRNLMTGESIIRAVRPEARLEIGGRRLKVGGLEGQVEQAYLLPEWIETLVSDPEALQFQRYETGEIRKRLDWKRKRWSPDLPWPPPGKEVVLHFHDPSPAAADLQVAVHYEMYDGLPLLCKWLDIHNRGQEPIRLKTFTSEILAVIESETSVGVPDQWERANLHIESDYAFHGMTPKSANVTAYWVKDPLFISQVNYLMETPCLLECRPPLGPDAVIAPGENLETFRTFELIFDSTDKERNGLAKRRMYRTVAPWVTENPIFMHLTSTDEEAVRTAIDQCREVGYEMVILSFGSGLNMESVDPDYIQRMKELTDYAHAQGIELGGYSLLASRSISDEHDVIHPQTGRPGGAIFGNSPCLGSGWGIAYFERLSHFIEATGFDILEHDGSYPGDVCASTRHPGHAGLEDSQWSQWRKITDFYRWCRSRGVYLNVPDWYFLSGSSKTGIGYREVNWSLPRERQIILGRQNIYDGTWYKTPSMGWTFVPLVEYHGGGEAATLEPLSQHLEAYAAHMAQNYGSGVQACYRGPRLYDSEDTKNLVADRVRWYKKYRDILNADIIHVRRPDGRDLDGILHVQPGLEPRGLAMVFNPTSKIISRSLTLPLYYTGLTTTARIREREGCTRSYRLDRSYRVTLPVSMPPRSFSWFVIE